MTDSELDPWELVIAHRYTEALAAYDARLQGGVENSLELANRSTVLLCLGRLSEALEGFQRADNLAAQRLHGETRPYLDKIASIFWLLGRRDKAIQLLTSAVDGVLNGSIKFADNAGGVTQGLLLWYAGVAASDDSAKEHSRKYLRKLTNSARIKQWPGPLAFFVLGEIMPENLLLELFGTSELNTLINKAKVDLLNRRRLVKALFYLATCRRSAGSQDESHAEMVRCATLENPILEIEWYLARAETEPAFRGPI